MPAQYVKAYIKRNKHDAADAEAMLTYVQAPRVPWAIARRSAAPIVHGYKALTPTTSH
jgi:hypothetical protein